MRELEAILFLGGNSLLGIGCFIHIGYTIDNGFKKFFKDIIIDNHPVAWFFIYFPILLLLISGLIRIHIQDNHFYSNLLFSLTH